MGKKLYIQLYNAKTGESITFPINPESVDLPKEKDIKTYNILNYGEVAIKGNRQLQRFTLSGLLPAEDSYFSLLASLIKQLNYKPYSLQETNEMIQRWIDNDEVIRVIISGKLNIECLIERSTPTIREYTDDEQYSLEFIEYRNPSEKQETPTIEGDSNIVKLKKRTINKYIPSQLVGKTGQTIYKLAKLTYGGKFKELADKNGLTNQNLSIAGKVVEMLPL